MKLPPRRILSLQSKPLPGCWATPPQSAGNVTFIRSLPVAIWMEPWLELSVGKPIPNLPVIYIILNRKRPQYSLYSDRNYHNAQTGSRILLTCGRNRGALPRFRLRQAYGAIRQGRTTPMRSAPLEGNLYARRQQKILDYPLEVFRSIKILLLRSRVWLPSFSKVTRCTF